MKANELVKTYDGTLAKRAECRNIKGKFYKKEEQCFHLAGNGEGKKWYRIDSGYVVFDHELDQYVIKRNTLVNGIIGASKGQFEMGYFTPKACKNVVVSSNISEHVTAICEDIVVANGYEELVYSDKEVFVPKEQVPIMKKKFPPAIPYKSLMRLDYSSKELIPKYNLEYQKNRVRLKEARVYSTFSRDAEKMTGTFGMEFESDSGRIPKRFLGSLGLMPLRDGSIRGDEYTTIPFKTDIRSLQTIEDICYVLKNYTTYTYNNSFHVHVRAAEFCSKYFVAAFAVNKVLEKEFYGIFPAYYRNTGKFKSSGKDYNCPLPAGILGSGATSHRTLFNAVYAKYSGGKSYESLGSSPNVGHPSDTSGNHKWQVGIRYMWINFVPLVFGGSNTVEYRIHPPTNNFHKISAWLYIINAVLQFANKYKEEICKEGTTLKTNLTKIPVITLHSIVKDIYGGNSMAFSLCNQYLGYRMELRSKLDKKEDYAGMYEIKHDDEFLPK